MSSVTSRINQIKQPYGGYLSPSSFERICLDDGNKLFEYENINAGLVGLVVDYMSRYFTGTDKNDAFKISLLGAKKANQEEKAYELLDNVSGLDDTSIISACKLVGYDVCFRVGMIRFKPPKDINPDEWTINNIRIMINRSLTFFNEYGPVIRDGITFEGGYSNYVTSGDADFLTKDTLWDFKVRKNRYLSTQDTLQLLMYYIMGMHANDKDFLNIEKLGVFNPRANRIFIKNICDISDEVIRGVENEVICYDELSLSVIDINNQLREFEVLQEKKTR